MFLFLAGALNDGAIETYGWPQVISVAGLTLIWRNAPDGERAGMRRLVQPLESLGASGTAARRATRLRFAGAAVLLAVGLGWLLSLHGGTQLLAAARRLPARGGRARAAARPLVAADRP